MAKTILITGATDGIGLETAKRLKAQGHNLIVHGRSSEKLDAVRDEIGGNIETAQADFSDLDAVRAMADDLVAQHRPIDVLINNAGVLKAPQSMAANGLDIRIVVNTLAPMVLTERLLPLIPRDGRVLNVSSAAQAPVDLNMLRGAKAASAMDAYAQSKLAITMWSMVFAAQHPDGPLAVAINPGSLLASKMVKEGFGVAGSDIGIGAEILIDAALGSRFAQASGRYFDNDAKAFGPPHSDALAPAKRDAAVATLQRLAKDTLS